MSLETRESGLAEPNELIPVTNVNIARRRDLLWVSSSWSNCSKVSVLFHPKSIVLTF